MSALPSCSASGGASPETFANTQPCHCSTRAGTRPNSARSIPSSVDLPNRGVARHSPPSPYTQSWYGQRIARPFRLAPGASSSCPRCRQTLNQPRSAPSPSRTSSSDVLPAGDRPLVARRGYVVRPADAQPRAVEEVPPLPVEHRRATRTPPRAASGQLERPRHRLQRRGVDRRARHAGSLSRGSVACRTTVGVVVRRGRGGPVRVLGVDPGLTRCGVGVVEGAAGRPLRLVHVDVSAPRPTPTCPSGCSPSPPRSTPRSRRTRRTWSRSSGSSASTTYAR